MSVQTYNKLKEMVEPALVGYHDDLRKHDFKVLQRYDGPFVYGYRRTGTDFLRMLPALSDYTWKQNYTIKEKKELLMSEFIWIDCKDRNNKFLYFDGKVIHKKTVEQLRAIWHKHIETLARNATSGLFDIGTQ